nr:T9SS type B sorting domain-containing protein [uncultured Flavobacterium sp.]
MPTSYPYPGVPAPINANLSTPQWSNTSGMWSTTAGASGQALLVNTPTGNSSITLTIDVASGYMADITHFDIWTRKSPTGPVSWDMTINGIAVGGGTATVPGGATGQTPVSNPVTGLTGRITVVINLINSGVGNFRIDDFALYGRVVPNCTGATVTGFSPASGPENTQVTFTGSGFNAVTAVTFDGIPATFTIVSDNTLTALVPIGTTTGNILINTGTCPASVTTPFSVLTPMCGNPDIYISEVFDSSAGRGDGGVIELYNPTSNDIHFNGNYVLERYGTIGDPSPSPGQYVLTLPGFIAAHSTYLIKCGTNSITCNGLTYATSSFGGINGSDQLKLRKLVNTRNDVIDVVNAPSSPGYTLIRKPNAIAPKEPYNAGDWNISGNESCTDLGRHTAAPPVVSTPTITNPISVTICDGTNTSFTSGVTGTGYTYQWKTLNSAGNWVNVTNNTTFGGATTNTLTINNATATLNNTQYYCFITSATCTLYSDAALLTVGGLPASTVTVTQATCTTGGQAVVTTPTGTGITYSINGGTFGTSATFGPLTPGNYNIVSKNAAGCTSAPFNFTINIAPGAPATPTLTLVQPSCTTATGTITVSNILAGAQYQLNTGAFQTTPSFSGLTPGSYTVTVRDAGGCTATSASVTINAAPSAPAVPTLTLTQPTCTTATGTITVSNVLAGAQYQLNTGAFQTTPSFSGLTPGNYTVTVRDAGGCTVTSASVTINTAPSAPAVPTLALTQPTCTTATGTITVSNILAGAQYQLNTGAFQTTPSFSGLTPGTYTVTVRDAGGCTATSASVTINAAPSAPAAPTLALTQPTCTTATGTITVSNVLTGAQYQLNTGAFQTTPSFSGLTPGNYTVTMRDAGGCTATSASVSINAAPSAPAVPTLALTQPSCTTATGTITVSNVLTGAQYQLNTGAFQSTPSFSGLTPGSYTVTVRDAGGCTATSASVTINTAPSAPATPTLTLVQPTCTTTTGTITVSNILAGAQYQLNTGAFQSTPSFAGVTPGTYTVTVRDAGGCTATSASVSINAAPSAPAVPTLTLIQPTCTTTAGTITVSNVLTGAQYQLNTGAFQTTPSFSGLTPGSYTVTVRDAGGCTATSASVTINPVSASYPALPLLSLVQPTCSVNTGSITIINPEPGTEYRVNGGPYQTATQFNLLPPGNYTIVARNAGGCTTTSGSVSIFTAPVVPSTPMFTVTQPDCITRTGTITVTSPLGTDLQYRLNTGGYQNSPVFTNVPAGTYTIIVRNANGCFATSANIIINAAPVIAPPVLSSVQATCAVPTGSISVTAPTGAGYQYSINGGAYQPTPQFSNLVPGTYTVIAQDANGCTSNASAVIFANPDTPRTPVITAVQPTCSVATGTLTVTAPLGTGYRYSINGGTLQTSPMFRMLAPGTYTITLRNSAGCESFATATINAQPGTPTNPVLSAVQPQCGDTTGSITVTSPTGGYAYSINGKPYQTSATFTQLAAGTYTIIAKNTSGCVSAPESIRINAAPLTPAVPLLTVVQPTCAVPHGTITVVSPVGAGYTYSIDGTTFQSGLVFTNLAGGSYTITVKNSTGCTAVSLPKIIDTPPAPAPSAGTITGNNSVCADATLQLANTVTGGVWSSSNTTVATVDANGLVTPVHAGTVIIRYTMGTTCPSETSMTITVNPLPYIRLTNVFLCVDNKTQAVISPKTLSTGLNDTDYTFVWEVNGRTLPDTTAAIQVNEAGQYTVTATTIATGCSDSATATVGISSIALATAEVGQDFSQNQVITVNVTGGSGDYVFTLDHGPFQTSPVFRGVEQGEHLITVYDANGCGRLDLPVFALDYPRFFTPNNDGNNDTWKIAGLSTQFDARIYIYDRFGKLITTLLPNSGIGWDGTLNGYPLPATDYWFSVLYKSSNGQQKEFRAHFSLLR